MSIVRTVRATLSERACLQCQRRKTKCIPGEPGEACVFCARAGRTCVFPDKPNRTPLTRKNLDDAEDQIRRLEELLQQHEDTRAIHGGETSDQAETGRTVDDADGRDPTEKSPKLPSRVGPAATPYEWNESCGVGPDGEPTTHADKAPDGMASLGDEGEASSYLGNSSGYSLLQSVSSLLQPNVATSQSEVHDSNRMRSRSQQQLIAGQSSCSYQLSATMMQDQLVNAYFSCYNSSYPILHERTFRDKCAIRSRLTRGDSWHLVYFMVLAIGEWILGYCSDEHSLYYDAARSRFQVEHLESGNANKVQAFLLMGNYLQKRDRPNTGYNFIGIANRMALGLGLHRETANTSGKDSTAMHRRRVLFWTLYSFDSGFSITTGRPLLVSDSFIDVRIPANVDDSQSVACLPLEVTYPTTYSTLIAQARLARIANKIYAQFMSALPCAEVDHHSSVMEQMLLNWRTSLPVYFFSTDVPDWFLGPRQIVLWKQANLHMLLLLASQRHHTDVHDKSASGRRYRRIAAETIQDITEFCQRYPNVHRGLSWYAIYFLLQACLALSVHQASHGSATHVAQSERDEDLRAYEEISERAHRCLDFLARADKTATRSLKLLSRVRENVRQSSTSPQSQPQESPRQPRRSQHLHQGGPNFGSLPDMSGSDVVATHSMKATTGLADVGGVNLTPGIDNVLTEDWANATDPSFAMFFNGANKFNELFQGVDEFP
ncbi:hypothetical protein LTR02_017878, partial [Friedmanniomyces endolithicus]